MIEELLNTLPDWLVTLQGFYEIPVLQMIVQSLLVLVPLLLSMAYLTLVERKTLGAIQLRQGPNTVGPFGLLQPFADALKLMHKEVILPTEAYKGLFLLAPVICFTTSIASWAVVPWGEGLLISDLNVGVLYLFALSSVGVYGVILAGWASQSRYALLGGLRATAQMISYEIVIGCILLIVIMHAGSMNLTQIVHAQKNVWFVVWHLPMAVIFFIAALAETNRAPFDLPESEAELVCGYNTEYSSLGFGLFFLGEYLNMILMSAMGSIFFLGGWLSPLPFAPFTLLPGFFWMALKVSLLLFVFIWVRGTLPRYRYDQLMRLGWKIFLPLTLVWTLLTAFFLLSFEGGVL